MFLILMVVFVVLVSVGSLVIQDRVLLRWFLVLRTIISWRVMENETIFSSILSRDKIWYRSKNMIYNFSGLILNLNDLWNVGLYF